MNCHSTRRLLAQPLRKAANAMQCEAMLSARSRLISRKIQMQQRPTYHICAAALGKLLERIDNNQPRNSGSLAIFAAIRLASSLLSAAIVKFSRNQTRAGQTSSVSRLTAAFGFSFQCDCAASREKEAVARRIRLSESALWNGPQLKR
jgi:hypothetical protein